MKGIRLGLSLTGVAPAASPPDTTAPTLTSPLGTKTGSSTADLGVTTDENNGTLYYVVTTSSTKPTATQVKAGQNNGGTAAAFAGSQAISSTGAKTASATGLSASTAYFAHYMHEDAAANQSTVATSSTFTTDAAADTTAPTLSSPVGTKTGSTTATIGATTDEANGTMYGVVSTSSTAPTATQVKAGQMHTGSAAAFAGSTSVASTGAKTISATGLTASTTYYAHIMHEDAAGNKSSVSTSASFTTDAASGTTLDPVNKDARWTLSNGNLTGTHTAGADDIVRGTNGHSGTGDWSFNMTFTGGSPLVGFCTSSELPFSTYLGSTNNSIGWDKSAGTIYKNGASVGTAASYTTSDTMTVRLKNGRMYCAKNGTYVLGDPTAETGGIDVSGMGTLFPAFSVFGSFSATFDFTNWP